MRLITYALMMKYGFNVSTGGRVLNPTAVFCNDRDRYYAMLTTADSGTSRGLEAWCTYVLEGVRDELKKVDLLTRYEYLTQSILTPAIAFARQRQWITHTEEAVLALAVKSKVVKSADLASVLPGLKSPQRTYLIRKLVDQGMLLPINEGARQYTIGFSNNYLIRGVIKALREEGFIPAPLENP